jgi:hypothetical protein
MFKTCLQLSRKSLDENEVERDFRFRRKICAVFNKTEDQFVSLDAFKDYEEMREDIIYNLVHEIDVAATEQRVKAYESENLAQITTNQSKLTEVKNKEADAIRSHDEQRRLRIAALQETMNQEKLMKKEHDKQMNEFLLGERDEISAKLPTTQSTTQNVQPSLVESLGAPNAVQLYLRQRPEPVPVSNTSKPVKMELEAQTVHRAGGYDHLSYTQRNWIEIVSSFSCSVEAFKQRLEDCASDGGDDQLVQRLKEFEIDVPSETYLGCVIQKKCLPGKKWCMAWK